MTRRRVGLAAIASILALSAAWGAGFTPWVLQVKREVTRLTAICQVFGQFWAVGEKGACYASADGKLWRKVKTSVDRDLYGVSFPESGWGCAVGGGGFIMVTEDNGEHWSAQKSGVTEDLRGVSFGSRETGVAVGMKGTLLVTHDGGKNWLKKDAGYGESFFAVCMLNAMEGWVVGERGIMLHSQDGGRTWVVERHPSQNWLYSIWFSANGTGWAAGRNGAVLRYMMKKWDEIPLPTSPVTLFSIAGEAGSSPVVVGANGSVWGSSDSGMSWQERVTMCRQDLTGIAMFGKVGWAVGAENTLYSTIDGGNTWASYSLESLPTYTAASFADPAFGWIVGRSGGAGMIWGTRDSGVTWLQQSPGGIRGDLTSIFCVSRSLAFATGEDILVKTDDGGLSWRRVYRDLSQEELAMRRSERRTSILNSVYFFDNRRGWAVGTAGNVIFTTDEGEFWEKMKTDIPNNLHAVWFLSPGRGFVAGADGMVYYTSNGGRKWEGTPVSSGGETLRSIYFVDADYGWIVGDGGTIISTRDGGKTWRELRMGGGSSLRKVWFCNRKSGWIAGERGILMKSWDGGESWVNDNPPVETDYLGLFFFSPDLGWAVGDRGVILKYNPSGESMR